MGIKYVRYLIIDVHGVPKSVMMPSSSLKDAFEDGVGFDGSSIPGYVSVESSDLVALPDPKTFYSIPGEDVAMLICDVYHPGGKPFEGSCRYVLRSVCERLREKGVGVWAGFELEYFYVKQGHAGLEAMDRGMYFDTPPLDMGEELRLRTIEALRSRGIEITRTHHEVAPGQHEIGIVRSEPVEMADKMVYAKLTVKALARREGYTATFMPKPFPDVNGSGCHVHISFYDLKTGRNLFFDEGGEYGLSEVGRWFIGGLMRFAPSISVVVAPTVNSYKRLVPHHEAPVYVCWGFANRTVLIRIPTYYPGVEGLTRVEYRHPDPSLNPYLGLAAVIQAGLYGVEHRVDPGEPCYKNVFDLSEAEVEELGMELLPEHLGEAVERFRADGEARGFLGEHVSRVLCELKEREFEEYMAYVGKPWRETVNSITRWEIERYLERA